MVGTWYYIVCAAVFEDIKRRNQKVSCFNRCMYLSVIRINYSQIKKTSVHIGLPSFKLK